MYCGPSSNFLTFMNVRKPSQKERLTSSDKEEGERLKEEDQQSFYLEDEKTLPF